MKADISKENREHNLLIFVNKISESIKVAKRKVRFQKEQADVLKYRVSHTSEVVGVHNEEGREVATIFAIAISLAEDYFSKKMYTY